jgi:predicted outer membrane protein
MDNGIIGIVVLVAIGGFVVWKMFFNKEESAPVVAKAPAPAPAVKKAEPKAVAVKEKVKVPTKTVLSKMTKKELDQLAKVDFGVTLDARQTKDKMIAALQKEVKAQNK